MLTEVKVNLVPAALAALENAAALNGHSKTDTVNRALQLYDIITAEMLSGAEILICRNGAVEKVELSL